MVQNLLRYYQIYCLYNMKNLVNYLDDYFDENLEETLCYRKFKENKNDYKKRDIINEDSQQIKNKKHNHKNKHENNK